MHVHAAEDGVDAGRGRAARELSGALDEHTLLAHGVHLGDDELALVRSANASVAHNARSNMNNAVGRARVGALGRRLALGTDGIGSDMFEESRTAYFRLARGRPRPPASTGRSRVSPRARVSPAGSFGEPLLGTLEPGAPADLVVLDYPAPAPRARVELRRATGSSASRAARCAT